MRSSSSRIIVSFSNNFILHELKTCFWFHQNVYGNNIVLLLLGLSHLAPKAKNRGCRRKYENGKKLDPFLILVNIAIGTAPIVIAIISVLTNMDPGRIVLAEFLPHPYTRNIRVIMLSFMIRSTVAIGFFCEVCRFGTYLLLLCTISFMAMFSIAKKLLRISVVNCVNFTHTYVQLKVIIASIYTLLGHAMGVFILLAHFLTIFALWISFRCWDYVNFLVAIVSIIIGCVCTVYIVIIFSAAGNYRARTEEVIKRETMLSYSTRANRVDRRYYFYLLWKSQLPAGIPCGPFFIIERSFVMAYLRELADNLVNAVLLIQPYKL